MPDITNNAALIIQGVAKSNSIRKLVSKSRGNQFRIKLKILPPLYLLSPYQESQNILEKIPIKLKIRTNVLRVSRNPSLMFSIRRVGFEIQFASGANVSLLLESLEEALAIENLKVYVSREVARHGYPTKFVDNTLEYELTRNWSAYDLILTRAKITIQDPKISNLMASRRLSVANKLLLADALLQGHYFREYLTTSLGEKEFKDSDSWAGQAEVVGHLPRRNAYTDLWKLIHLKDAKVLHGKIVFSDNKFYLGDNMKIPSFGSSYNQWPSHLFQNSDGIYFSPTGKKVGDTLEEAIFLGGTKNIMHFVIEDLPRIYLPDDLGISESAPLIVAKTLGPQILSLIELLSKRSVIQLDSFEMVSVRNLHILDFNNPLMETMSGDRNSAALLFSENILDRTRSELSVLRKSGSVPRKRIFIRREPGLFRPLINVRRVQWMLERIFQFETHFLMEKSLKDIQQIFVDAEIVVAEYGAGLSNILFAGNKCKVIEIRGAAESNAIEYETLLNVLGHEHYLVKGRGKKFSRHGITRGPYKVSVKAVRKLLVDLI